jgi:uncharacterized surface protein with fasciclin (FAS1) repeats
MTGFVSNIAINIDDIQYRSERFERLTLTRPREARRLIERFGRFGNQGSNIPTEPSLNKGTTMKQLTIPALIAVFFTVACAGSQTPANENRSPAVATAAPSEDIVETAVGAGQFTTLVAALQAADLVDALKSNGPFTVFAPTDEAFAKLPAGTVEALLEDKDKLVQVLTYHVVSGKVLAADVGAIESAKTLQGQSRVVMRVVGKPPRGGKTHEGTNHRWNGARSSTASRQAPRCGRSDS